MMNVLALCFVLSSLVSSAFFSPPQQQEKKNMYQREDLIVKEANRIIMVEYEIESQPRDTNNRPSPPSPPPPQPSLLEEKLNIERAIASGVLDSTKKKLKEASSFLPNIGQGLSDSPSNEHHYNPKELICDVYGKCKHKLAGVFGKAKEGASEKAHDVEEAGERAMEKAKETLGKAKDSVYEIVHGVEEVGEKATENAKETLGKAKDSMYEKAHGIEEVGETAKERTKEAFGKVKETGETILGKTKEAGEMAMEKTKEGLGKAKETVCETGEETLGKTKEGLEKAKESVHETGEAAMGKVRGGLEKTKESVSEKAQEVKQKGKEAGNIAMENLKSLGQGLVKEHHSLWDERTIKEKARGLYQEGGRNLTTLLHRGRRVFYNAANHLVSKEVVHPTVGAAYLLGLATAYGITMWVTFMSSHVLAGALPRQQFGIVQSKIYPVYFRALLGSIGCALLAHAWRNPNWGLKTYQTYNMLVSLSFVLFNLLYLEPQATKVMFDKMKLEKEEGRRITGEADREVVEPDGVFSTTTTVTPTTTTTTATTTEEPSARSENGQEVRSRLGVLNKRLKNLNSISSLLNVLTLMALTWQLVYLGRALPVT